MLKPGGMLYMLPAWQCTPWAVTLVPNWTIRSVASAWGPTRLRYRRITPNYQEYWMADSDAVNSLDRVETAMWFESRGDTCLNCERGWKRFADFDGPLIIRRGPN